MTTMQQLVVGVFRDHAQAEQAINELQQAGFDNHQIQFAGQGISTGGILEKIKSMFTGQDISAGDVYEDLVNMGTPPEDARYYQHEFEAGHSVVAVQGTGVPLVARSILARYGGYGANQRFAQSPDYDQGIGVPEPNTGDVYTETRHEDPFPSRSPDYNRGTQEPSAEDVYIEPRRADQHPPQSPDYNRGTQEPSAEDVYTEPRRADQRPPQSPDDNKGLQKPTSEDANTEPRKSSLE